MGDSNDDRGGAASAAQDPQVAMPRWVKVSVVVVGALVLLFVLTNITGLAGDHGPGRHGGGGSADVVEDDGGHRSLLDHGG